MKSDPNEGEIVSYFWLRLAGGYLFLAQGTPVRSVDKVCSVSDTQGEAVQTTSQFGKRRNHQSIDRIRLS